MKYAEVMIQALYLMFADPGEQYAGTADEVERAAQDANYRDYILAMPGSMTRAFAYLETRCAVPMRRAVLTGGEETSEGLLFTEDRLPQGFPGVLVRVSAREEGWTDEEAAYILTEDSLLLCGYGDTSEVTVLYRPSLPACDESTDLNMKIPLPDELCALLPYYIKSDLYMQDEADEAVAARSVFESGVERWLQSRTETRQTAVRKVYGVEWA